MTTNDEFLNEFHWVMDVLQNIDVGLVVLDKTFSVRLWNSFMQNHSARGPEEVLGHSLFSLFPELPEPWFKRKAQSVMLLGNSAFTTWEQRPYLFRFRNYRPVTGRAEFMYQNSTLIPLTNTRGQVEHLCIILYDVTEVAINRLQLQQANHQLYLISRTDGLTGLLNRKTWEACLQTEFRRFARYRHSCSLIMFDIDHFKRVNDGYGHPAGDEVIRQVAAVVKKSLRDTDIAGRYGGEEFGILLIDTEGAGALILAERLRQLVEATTVYYEDHVINFTISLGVAELTPQMTEPTLWIDSADRGLYRAKRAGRNRSVLYERE